MGATAARANESVQILLEVPTQFHQIRPTALDAREQASTHPYCTTTDPWSMFIPQANAISPVVDGVSSI